MGTGYRPNVFSESYFIFILFAPRITSSKELFYPMEKEYKIPVGGEGEINLLIFFKRKCFFGGCFDCQGVELDKMEVTYK